MRTTSMLISVGLLSAAATNAVAVTSTDFTYSRAQIGYLTIGPNGLSPMNHVAAGDFEISVFPPSLTTGIRTNACYSTNVHLPQGAQILSLVSYYRSGATSDVQSHLTRTRLTDGLALFLAGQGPVDDTGARKSITTVIPADRRVVRNDLYLYGFSVASALATRSMARVSLTAISMPATELSEP